MIIKLRKDVPNEVMLEIKKILEESKMIIVQNESKDEKIIGVIGDTKKLDVDKIKALNGVIDVCEVKEPYKRASRKFHPEDTIVKIDDETYVGGNKLTIIAGPCSVENESQIIEVAQKVKDSGATLLRGGAFKPRTSPYAFQGLKYAGLELLKKAREKTGLKIVTELMSSDDIEIFEKDVDIIQIGARNMQNFDLLKKVGKINKPILLKRGISATIEEWLMAAEYIMSEGNENVILCERGIRTYETATRNTLDLSAIPMIKKLSHLPVIVDPSHAAGLDWMVEPLSKAAIACGADGLIIEVHNNPKEALCDGKQSITPEAFDSLMNDLRLVAKAVNRNI